jgi:hypothetical protein
VRESERHRGPRRSKAEPKAQPRGAHAADTKKPGRRKQRPGRKERQGRTRRRG